MRYVLILILFSCTITNPRINDIRTHPQYINLSSKSKVILEKIMGKASKSPKSEYYFNKLELLLNTPVNPSKNTKKLNQREINRSVKIIKKAHHKILRAGSEKLEAYMSREEDYELSNLYTLTRYQPKNSDIFFYIDNANYLDILIHIIVRLNGEDQDVKQILGLEDAIEKHLHIHGFSVNLVFALYSSTSDDIFDIKVNLDKWTTSLNWSGGYKALAHELLHLMGLPDEYDLIEVHADNANMSIYYRLVWFYHQMNKKYIPNNSIGIMRNRKNKILQRNVCAAVGLGKDCTEVREDLFGK